MATIPVKYYTSTMTDMPQVGNAWGDLVTMLDAVLVNGFGQLSLTSLTQAGGVATATISGGHTFAPGQVILIASASDAAFNGEFRITGVTGTTFTFAVTGAGASATGATAAVAPLNWDIAFTGTNKRVYRSRNVLSNRPYLRVDNSLDPAYTTTFAKKGKVTMCEAMTGIDTFTAGAGRAPYLPSKPTQNEVGTGSGTSAVDGWAKWYHARTEGTAITDSATPAAGNRNFVLVGDDRGFYLMMPQGLNTRGVYAFTDFLSFKTNDAYSTALISTESVQPATSTTNTIDTIFYQYAGYSCGFLKPGNFPGQFLMRDHTGYGNHVRFSTVTLNTNGTAQLSSGAQTGVPWPNGPDYSLVLHPMYMRQESDGSIRGKLPGVMFVHNNFPMSDLTVVDNVAGYPGREFLLVSTDGANSTAGSSSGRTAFDITGPWW